MGSQSAPSMEGSRKKHNIQGDIRTVLGKDCEMEKIMMVLKGKSMFVEV